MLSLIYNLQYIQCDKELYDSENNPLLFPSPGECHFSEFKIKGGQMKRTSSLFKLFFLRNHFIYIVLIFLLNTIVCIQPAMAERMAISKTKANIRSGPGITYDILWQVEKYYPIEVVRKVGEWYFFKDFEGDTGWIKNTIIDRTKTVITSQGNQVNVRSGPGIQYNKVFMVERGVPFKVLDQQGNWIKIEHADGDKGWIYKNLVW
jgi:SH3-like domain-containing protein